MSAEIITDSRERLGFHGDSARTIMGTNQAALLQLPRDICYGAQPEDLSAVLGVQLGTVSGGLNRHWYESNADSAVTIVKLQSHHPVQEWIAATLDGLVDSGGAGLEAKFMLPWTFSEEAAVEKRMTQLQHNTWVANARPAVQSIITGGGRWGQHWGQH